MPRRWPRFSLRALFALSALAAIAVVLGLRAFDYYDNWYRWDRSRTEFVRVALHKDVPVGSHFEDVARILGRGKVLSDADSLPHRRLVTKYPEATPDGLEASDNFVRYTLGDGVGLILQFRNGKLVNHSPEHYVDQRAWHDVGLDD
jgi:hypothetical protein